LAQPLKQIVFGGSTLDRAALKRSDASWLRERLADDATRVLPVWRLSPLIRTGDTPRLAWATPALLDGRESAPEPVFLGVAEGIAHFAADLSDRPEPLDEFGFEDVAHFPDLRAIAGLLPAGDAAIAAQARHLLDWHSRHGFCPGCGEATKPKDGAWARWCNSCSTEHFPRTDPVVIMLVLDDERCLLGRQPAWPRPFFSALAGFVEGGETLEEAVQREVAEEAGIAVSDVRYLASQPWPFPASLMLGCTARASTREIVIDGAELAEADWFTRDEVRAALSAATTRLAVPPPLAIAHHLIRAWAQDDLG
jgi:NAD+ diphosphatase